MNCLNDISAATRFGEPWAPRTAFTRLIVFVLIMSSGLLVPNPRASAQEALPGPTVVPYEDLPDAPQARSMVSSVESFDKPSVDGQNGSNAGVPEGEQDNARKPPSALEPQTANISGTVIDVNGGIVSGAAILLEGPNPGDRRTTFASDNGAFEFANLKPGTTYKITIEANNFESWKSAPIILTPGQYYFQLGIELKLSGAVTSVTVYASQEQIATEQVKIAEKQRVFGFIPNFYVTYDSEPVPLTTKLKFRLAYRASTDVMTFVGIAFMAGIYQAGDYPDYRQGAKGYGQRVGAGLADSATDIFFGGAILPSLLRQDPRYFYKGTGTNKSRALHAIFSPFVCKGDNGKSQPNYSSLGGDLISGAVSNIYYPDSNRGVALVLQGFLVTTGVRTVNALIQEFVLRKLTPSARGRN